MISVAIAASMALVAQTPQPVTLSRTFTKGEKLVYEVKGKVQEETRGSGLITWLPSDNGLEYKFTLDVTDLKADGIAVAHYQRPTITDIQGETYDTPQKSIVRKINQDYEITVSPVNEVINVKDLTKKPEPKKGGKTGGKVTHQMLVRATRRQIGEIIGAFTSGLGQLVMFVGGPTSGLELEPKLPFDEVTPGFTWKKTAGFTPQQLKGEGGKMAVQRMDYTYTYNGPTDVGGKTFVRIHAELALDTNLADYIHQAYDLKPEDTGLKSIPFKLKSQMDFDLDPKTLRTVKATASAKGEAQLFLKGQDDPYQEMKLTGRTTMRLVPAKP